MLWLSRIYFLPHRNNSLLKSSKNFGVPCSTESTLLLNHLKPNTLRELVFTSFSIGNELSLFFFHLASGIKFLLCTGINKSLGK